MTEADWLSAHDSVAALKHVCRLRCRACGTWWIDHLDGSMSLDPQHERAPACCDNAPFSHDRPLVSDRKLRLFMCACARRLWGKLDARYRRAVAGAEAFADGLATHGDLEFERAPALVAFHAPADAPSNVHSELVALAASGPMAAIDMQFLSAALGAGVTGPEQCAILRDVVGTPSRPLAPEAAWLTPTVRSLATACYLERPGRIEKCQECEGKGGEHEYPADDPTNKLQHGSHWYSCGACGGSGSYHIEDGALDPHRLAVLADALEEAGCDSEPLLRHLRGWERCWLCVRTNSDPTCDACSVCGQLGAVGPFGRPCAPGWVPLTRPHVRGCWAVDLILGKD